MRPLEANCGARQMPTSLDWDGRWSEQAKALAPPQLAAIVNKHAQNPDVIGMHGGLPPASAFPFTSISCGLAAGGSLDMGSVNQVNAAQQYNLNIRGYAPLVEWARSTTEAQQRPAQPIDVVVTPGATAALEALLSLLLNPGDALLVEQFTYSHALEGIFIPRRYQLMPVRMDEQGLLPSDLRAVLQAAQQSGAPMPRALYLIPTGQNPTGAIMGRERMAQIYEVACEYDLVVIEDDAYYWLSWPQGEQELPGLNLPSNFLSLDTQGRVVRIDTLAKLLGPGFRLGWVSGAPALVTKLALAINAAYMGPSSLSQVMIHSLLQQWGRDGFEDFVRSLQAKYASQAALTDAAARKHVADVATWVPARAGMFLWIKLLGVPDADAVLAAAAEQQVVVVPGKIFDAGRYCSPHTSHSPNSNGACNGAATNGGYQCAYFRVSFASLPPSQIDEGFRRLRAAIDSCCPDAIVEVAATAGGCCLDGEAITAICSENGVKRCAAVNGALPSGVAVANI